MKYCSRNTSFTDIWYDEGLNICFLDTLTSGLLFVFMIVFGCIQCARYRRNSIPVVEMNIRGGCGYNIQKLLTFILILEAVLRIVLQDVTKVDSGEGITGSNLINFFALVITWSGSLKLLSLERSRFLPRRRTRGHSLMLLIFWCLAFVKENLAFVSYWSHSWWWYLASTQDRIDFGLWLIRYVISFFIFVLGLKAPGLALNHYATINKDEEQGNTIQANESTWKNVWKKLKIMIPYVWPKGSWWRQIVVIFCLVLLVAGRVNNIFVPLYSKYIVNSLSTHTVSVSSAVQDQIVGPEFRWDLIIVYSVLLFLQGGATGTTGFLNNLRSFLWIPVQQWTTRCIQVKLYSHLHSLSLRWHLKRKTGEVLRVIDRGTNSINNLLSYVVFSILPTIVDIIIAIVYFITAFNYVFGIVVFIAMALYLFVTVKITEWRTKYRREMNSLDNAMNSKAVDSLLNFETVKYYGASQFEVNRYNSAILEYQKAELKATATLNLLNSAQNIVITSGVLSGSMLCAWAVVHNVNGLHLNLGDYILFGTYLLQLYGPLNYLGTYYRMIQQAFIDMENMFELLDEDIEVKDIPGAKDLMIKEGKIEFHDVCFNYEPSKAILKNVSFTVPAGQTFALVGHSGSGKSTIIRLLFRFYDVQSGSIKIDGQDIALVKQESLRHCIGVVPQDTVLFNTDIRYNIHYGRVTAMDSELEEAAKAADIHDRILNFPSKYDTVVGERGLKLSGGEKQRVAIARTLLKAPAIVLLDEATSALDTKTERNIQSSLARVCENRTTIIVAHRLSTIIHADQIMVLHEGEIIESGKHEELLEKGGAYAEMWLQQQKKQDEGRSDIESSGETDKL
ncbi:hypothetical protein CHS0354_017861 [Potamilus streckersoni]|uniref:ATP-binding cassette sub-family B member 6 n=1 Tax=Potamilus streckersoni TaxID=2493646 RepID=A0AAE0W7A3_9BIVA|nr:hypothetical protein CHS0354_017861 [Potamilus streckersoni]